MHPTTPENFEPTNDRNAPRSIEVGQSHAHAQSLPHGLPQCLSECLCKLHKPAVDEDLQPTQTAASRLIQDRKKLVEFSREIDHLLLNILTLRVRVLSLPQICDLSGQSGAAGVSAAKRRAFRLEKKGLVHVYIGLAHPELTLVAPLTTWVPGDDAPDFGRLSYALRSRWRMSPVKTTAVIASTEAGILHGGFGGRIPRTSELTHDLSLARVYINLLRSDPRRASKWSSEAALFESGEGRGDKLPDALITERSGKTAIEFGGAYRASKLSEFHAFCLARNLSYEIW